MKKTLLVLSLSAICFPALSQITTINYLTSGGSTIVDGYTNTIILNTSNDEEGLGLPGFQSGYGMLLSVNLDTLPGEPNEGLLPQYEFAVNGYSINFPFLAFTKYSITLNLNVIAHSYTAGTPAVGLGVSVGTPTFTSSVSSAGFLQQIETYLYDAHSGISGYTLPTIEAYAPTANHPIPYLNNPIYANYLETTGNTSVTLPTFSVGSNTTGLNIEAVGSPIYSYGDEGFAIGSIVITATPDILPAVAYTCTSQTYSVNTTQPVTWSASPSGIVSLSPNGNEVTVTKLTEGNVTLSASFDGVTSTFAISTEPQVSSISTNISGSCEGSWQTWEVAATANAPNATNWAWTATYSDGEYEISSPNSPNTFIATTAGLGLSVTFKDACGVTSAINGTTIWSECGEEDDALFDASPNPAKSFVNILPRTRIVRLPRISPDGVAPTSSTPTLKSPSSIREVKVFDVRGRLRYDLSYGSGSATSQLKLDVSKLENGVYFVLIYNDGKTERKKILVQH